MISDEQAVDEVRSDRLIDPAMASVLDDATRRLSTSELHDPGVTFDIFICNEPWGMWHLETVDRDG